MEEESWRDRMNANSAVARPSPLELSRRILFVGVSSGALLVLASHTACAAGAPSTAVEEVVVTAQRRSENVQHVPIAMQALSSRMIQSLGIKSSTDISQVTPNVDIGLPNGAGNQPIITIRGIGLNDYDSNNAGPNGVYVDEAYLSSPASQTFQAFDLDRIEVLKGPQGTLYGRNASGGAINFISAKPTDQFTDHLHVEYSSFDTVNVEGAVGGPISPTLDGRIAAVYNYSQGYSHNLLTGNDENGADNYGVRLQLKWKPINNFTALLSLHGGQVDNRPTEYRMMGVFAPGTFNPNTFAFTECSVGQAFAGQCVDAEGYHTQKGFYDGEWDRQQHLKVNNLGATLRLEYDPGTVKLTSITSFEHNDKNHPEDSDAGPNNLVDVTYGVRNDTITEELRASQTLNKFDWVAGAYVFHEDLHQNQPAEVFLDWDQFYGPGAGNGLAEISFDRSSQQTTSYAVYGQGDYNFTDKLKLTLGGRFTTEHKTFATTVSAEFQDNGEGNFSPIQALYSFSGLEQTNSAFNYRAALNYQFTQEVLAYASITTGFKSGDFNGGFLSNNAAEAARQLQPVLPETVTAYEVGLKSTWFDHRLLVDLAAFYNDYRDEQVFVEVLPVAGGTGLPLNVLDNAPKAHTEGLDAEFVARPFRGLTFTNNLGLLETRIDEFTSNRTTVITDYTGHRLPLAPKFSYSGILDYKTPLGAGAVDFQVSANYRSMQHFDLANSPYTTQAAYWLANMRLGYIFDHNRMEAAVFVHNLFDKQYLSYSYDLSNPFGIIEQVVGPPRSVGVSIDYRY
jgi:iron complex outermembrane receptor protein